MSGTAATPTADEPRDFLTAGLVVLFWGGGLATFLSLTDTWFDGVRFYAVSPSIVAIAVIAVGILSLLAAISAPQPVAPRSRRHQVLFGIALLLWIVLGGSYRFTSDFGRLSTQHELVRAYRADPGCSADLLSEMGKRGPAAPTARGASAASICQLGWTTVGDKTGAGSCLVLRGAPMSGAYCVGERHAPDCDWRELRVGDSIVAQKANQHPAAYFCPTKDPISIPFYGRGVVIQTLDNPAREFQRMFINRLLLLGVYLVFGMAICYRVIQ